MNLISRVPLSELISNTGPVFEMEKVQKLNNSEFCLCSRNNVVCTMIRVRARLSGFRVVLGTRDVSLSQNVETGSGAHTASCLVGTGVLFPEVK